VKKIIEYLNTPLNIRKGDLIHILLVLAATFVAGATLDGGE
jgi:hypothetical protein